MSTTNTSGGMLHLTRMAIFGTAAVCLGVAAAERWQSPTQAEVSAVVSASITEIVASRDCRLEKVFVEAGSTVTEGTPLLEFSDSGLDAALVAKQRERDEARAELQRCEATAKVELTWRRRELQREIHEARLELHRLQQEQLSRKVEQIAWSEHLQELDLWMGGKRSDRELQPVTLTKTRPDADRLQALLKEDAAASAAEALQKQIALIEQRLVTVAAVDENLETNVQLSAGVDVARARVDRIDSELATLEEHQRDLTIVSHDHGTVGIWRHQPGDSIVAGTVVVEILDEARTTLVAYVPSQQVGRLQAEDTVEIEFPGYGRRRGTILSIPPQVQGDQLTESDPKLPVRIAPAGKLWPRVPIGSRVHVQIPRG